MKFAKSFFRSLLNRAMNLSMSVSLLLVSGLSISVNRPLALRARLLICF